MRKGAAAISMNDSAVAGIAVALRRAASLKVTRRIQRPEQQFQISLVQFLGFALPKSAVLFHVPNGGKRSRVEASIFKAMGVKAGIPDLVIVFDERAFGLECKDRDGSLSADQKDMHRDLRSAGMRLATVTTIDEAIIALLDMGIPLNIAHETLVRIGRTPAR